MYQTEVSQADASHQHPLALSKEVGALSIQTDSYHSGPSPSVRGCSCLYLQASLHITGTKTATGRGDPLAIVFLSKWLTH